MTGDGRPGPDGSAGRQSHADLSRQRTRGLKASYVAHSPITAAKQVPVGRWDADGAPDTLFRRDNRLHVFLGNGPGGLTGSKPWAPTSRRTTG